MKTNRQVLYLLLFLAGIQLILSTANAASAATKLVTSEVTLCKIPPQVKSDNIVAAIYCTCVAFQSARGGREFMVVDGVEGALYDKVGTAFVSPNGLTVAHFASRDNKIYIVVNGVARGPYDDLDDEASPPILFSPDGKHIAYTAKRNGKWFVVIDDTEGQGYDRIEWWQVVFSPDSKRVGYVAIRGNKHIVVLDGVEQGESDEVEDRIIFSPDNSRVAWNAVRAGRQAVVINGTTGRDYALVAYITFSPNSRSVGYIAKGIDDASHLVVDGQEVATGTSFERFIFSPDSKRLAYYVRRDRDRSQYVAVDGIETNCSGLVDDYMAFSPDSKHFAYLTSQGNSRAVIIDGVKGKWYETVDAPQFSPNSKHFLYVAYQNGHRFVVIDGKEGQRYDNIEQGYTEDGFRDVVLFSPDNTHMAYVATRADKQCVVVDGVESIKYDGVNPDSLQFSPDSRHLAYVVQRNGKQFVTVDGIASHEYDALLPYNRIAFETANVIRALARRGDKLLRVHITITEG